MEKKDKKEKYFRYIFSTIFIDTVLGFAMLSVFMIFENGESKMISFVTYFLIFQFALGTTFIRENLYIAILKPDDTKNKKHLKWTFVPVLIGLIIFLVIGSSSQISLW